MKKTDTLRTYCTILNSLTDMPVLESVVTKGASARVKPIEKFNPKMQEERAGHFSTSKRLSTLSNSVRQGLWPPAYDTLD